MRCSCCGVDIGCFALCEDCDRYFAWQCLLPHRMREHGYVPGPNEEHRYLYRHGPLPNTPEEGAAG